MRLPTARSPVAWGRRHGAGRTCARARVCAASAPSGAAGTQPPAARHPAPSSLLVSLLLSASSSQPPHLALAARRLSPAQRRSAAAPSPQSFLRAETFSKGCPGRWISEAVSGGGFSYSTSPPCPHLIRAESRFSKLRGGKGEEYYLERDTREEQPQQRISAAFLPDAGELTEGPAGLKKNIQ